MAEPRLQEGENVLFSAHPGSWAVSGLYFWTLGFYSFWRKATYFVVTDHRVIRTKGIVSKTQRNVPLEMIQDASLGTGLGIGSVTLSSAGGRLSVQKLSPMTADEANRMIDIIMKERKQVQARVLGSAVGQSDSTNPSSQAMTQLQQLSHLRDSGVLSQEEYDAKKAELLGRI